MARLVAAVLGGVVSCSRMPELHAFAEDPHAFLPLDPGTERVFDERYVLSMKPSAALHANVALRLRLEGHDASDVVQEIRARAATRENPAVTWLVGSSATPVDVVTRLVELGGTPHPVDPVLAAMLLVEPPADGPAALVVRKATTRDDFRAARAIELEGLVDERPDSPEQFERDFRQQCQSGFRAQYLAFEGDAPIATARAIFAERGVSMSGGATRAAFRGRGAYRALVRARWEDAVARGTPALVTHAGRMSRPILERLGFACVAEVVLLVDGDRAR